MWCLFVQCAFGQIIVSNEVSFGRDRVQNEAPSEALTFSLKVFNHTNSPIPDLSAKNVRQNARFIVNDKATSCPADFGGLEAQRKGYLKPGESDTYGWATVGLGTNTYGEIFTVRWEYLGVSSDTLRVDMKRKTVERLRSSHAP